MAFTGEDKVAIISLVCRHLARTETGAGAMQLHMPLVTGQKASATVVALPSPSGDMQQMAMAFCRQETPWHLLWLSL